MPNKNDRGNVRERPDADARYYELKTAAVDDLVSAKRGKSKTYSMEELDKYRSHKGIRVPEWVKILFIKAWMSGAVCFFFLWGLGIYLPSVIDQLFVLGMALGFATDLLTNSMIRFFERQPGTNDRWMMFPKKRYVSLLLNIPYAYLIIYLVYTVYSAFNAAMAALSGQPDAVALGVEPIVFGLLCMLFDLGLVWMKNMFLRVVRDARDKVEGKK